MSDEADTLFEVHWIEVSAGEYEHVGKVSVRLPSMVDIPPSAARIFAKLLNEAADEAERQAATANP